MRTGNYPRSRTRGFTLLAVLAAAFVLALGAQVVVTVLSQQAQREREARLLQIGREYAQAIGSYYESSPGLAKQYPVTLEDLLEDRRFVGLKRHLRRNYADPLAPGATLATVTTDDGRIRGVHSTSKETPLRSVEVDLDSLKVGPATCYCDWKFIYVPPPAAPRT